MAKIAIGITGSIAAYRACEVVREIYHAGHEVRVVLTPAASHFVTPLTLEVLSGHPVYSREFADGMSHIEIKQDLDLLVVVPASANTIGKMANGLADNLLLSTYLAVDFSRTSVLVCPAMNPNMYKHPAHQRNLERLRTDGVHILDPGEGVVACGDEGTGRMAEPAEVVARVTSLLQTT